MNQEIKDKVVKVRNEFIRSDKIEPFTNREYVNSVLKVADILLLPDGDLQDPIDRAVYDFVEELIKEVQNG